MLSSIAEVILPQGISGFDKSAGYIKYLLGESTAPCGNPASDVRLVLPYSDPTASVSEISIQQLCDTQWISHLFHLLDYACMPNPIQGLGNVQEYDSCYYIPLKFLVGVFH